jgi:2-methylcitrate dehydratase
VTVTLGDGTKLVEEVAFPPGHDKNPLSDEQLAHKFHGLVDPVLGTHQAGAIWDRVSHLEDDPAPHSVLELIQAGTHA